MKPIKVKRYLGSENRVSIPDYLLKQANILWPEVVVTARRNKIIIKSDRKKGLPSKIVCRRCDITSNINKCRHTDQGAIYCPNCGLWLGQLKLY